MKVITPTPSQAAFVLKKFLTENGFELSLAKTQEAISRILGFSDWNVLSSVMDPRVGYPKGCLQHVDDRNYTLTTGTQSYAFITVNNIEVSIKHDDEGVVVDVYSKIGLINGEEPLGSTWVSFDEADEEEKGHSEEETCNPAEEPSENFESISARSASIHASVTFAIRVLEAEKVADSFVTTPSNFVYRNTSSLISYVQWEEIVGERVLFEYISDNHKIRKVTVFDLNDSKPLGETGIQLVDGTKIFVFPPPVPKLSPDLNTPIGRFVVTMRSNVTFGIDTVEVDLYPDQEIGAVALRSAKSYGCSVLSVRKIELN